MESIYLSLHCHHQNDSCIKMGSNESHFNVSLIVSDTVTRLTTAFLKRKESRSRIEPRSFYFKPAHKPSCWPHSGIVELCESRGGRPGLSVLTSLLVSVDVKIY